MSITLHAMFFVIIVAFCFILCASVCVSLESEHSLNGWSLWFLGFLLDSLFTSQETFGHFLRPSSAN